MMVSETRERPILFSAPMVRAILDGSKTQTRRLIKLRDGADVVVSDGKVWKPARVDYAGFVDCPYGVPGDRLWVRETFALSESAPYAGGKVNEQFFYRADGETYNAGLPWKPSIYMPRRASRITLELTAARVERLVEISEADALAEGVQFMRCDPAYNAGRDARTPFKDLWDSINAKRAPWAANPWTWVLEFKRV